MSRKRVSYQSGHGGVKLGGKTPYMRGVLETAVDGEALASIEMIVQHFVAIVDEPMMRKFGIKLTFLQSEVETHGGAGMRSLMSWCTSWEPIPAFSDSVYTSAINSKEPRIIAFPMSLKVGATNCKLCLSCTHNKRWKYGDTPFSTLPPRSMTFLPTAGCSK